MDVLFLKSGVLAIAISMIFTPFLIKLSHKKGFFASKDHRSSHDKSTPNTGGMILCFAILIPLIIYSSYPDQEDFSLLISAFSVLLITGIIDDFNPIPVVFKLLGQFIPAIVIVTSIDEHELVIPFLDQLNLPYVFNYLFWILFIVISINAFNLIDGIDGLAISLGIIGGVFYFFKFLNLNEFNLVIFSISLIGGLIGLLYYNFSAKNKIFIGDTGSLLIGGLLAFFALKFIGLSDDRPVGNSFFLVIGSFFLPLMDMIRVSLVRIANGNSPFKADREHLHHIVVSMVGGKHFLATTIIVFCQIGMIFLFKSIQQSTNLGYLSMIMGTACVYFLLMYLLSKRFEKKAA